VTAGLLAGVIVKTARARSASNVKPMKILLTTLAI
jgi:hypothetical protein